MGSAQNACRWRYKQQTCAHGYILPVIITQVDEFSRELEKPLRILDIGCGSGYVATKLAELGHFVIGIDTSPGATDVDCSAYPNMTIKVCSVYDDKLVEVVGELVDCVISTEVVEHLFHPRRLFEQSHRLLKNGGHLIISTPYHGYLKNLAISLTDSWDRHFRVAWDGDHIKFFSKKTFKQMVSQVGFRNIKVKGVGRLPWLWKSMVMIAEK